MIRGSTGERSAAARKSSRFWTRWFAAGCAALLILGLAVRLPYLAGAGFPLNDGGLPTVMMQDLRANDFILPVLTSYNSDQIPFVYPPLAVYMGAAIETLGGLSAKDVLLWLPLILSLLCLPAMALLGRSVLDSPAAGLWAGAAFALLPSAYIWQIMGAGLMRSAGFLFGILTLWQAHEILRTGRRQTWRMASTGILAALTLLSHPALPIPIVTGIALMWVAESREVGSLIELTGAAAVALVVTSPWWALVLWRFGTAPWAAAATTTGSGGLLGDPSVLLHFSGEASPTVFMVLGVLGSVAALVSRKWFLPAWLVGLFVVDPHGAIGSACLPLALLVGLARISHTLPAAAADAPAGTAFLAAAPPATCFEHASAQPGSKHHADRRLRALATEVCEICGLAMVQVVLPGLFSTVESSQPVESGLDSRGDVEPAIATVPRAQFAVVLVAVAILGIGLLGNAWLRTDGWTPLHPLPSADREAMAWIATHTPSTSAFVALGPALHWYDDSVGEWFPALAERRCLTTVQGTEWLPGGVWQRRREARKKLIETAWSSAEAFRAFVVRELGDFRGVYLSRQALRGNPRLDHLARLISLSPGSRLVFSGRGGVVFLMQEENPGRP